MLIPLVSREVVLRLLQTEHAPRITAALDRTGASVVVGVTPLLNGRMAEGWSMEQLARKLRVSESTLFARFEAATGITPAQYLKRTRLGETRRRMVLHGDTAAQAAAPGGGGPECVALLQEPPGGAQETAGGGCGGGAGGSLHCAFSNWRG
ncbi:helix-turn-helix domain-containing protein [Curtobacterium sp. 'Ferrero']|uniref:helix-turn-helix domain-containing protein n=1 Tax=Curtobacterium sp. 'Ferrero' TaxID=2033654 RepID=UPI00114387F7|nr:AraC family transcriptional regulator [Curtobacterium sp. 'Ferrero']